MKSSSLHLCILFAASLSTALAFAPPSSAQTGDPIKTSITGHGFVGDLYTPADVGNRKLPAIIVFGGSEGGLGAGAAREARTIAAHGYVVLQLAYFDTPGLSKELGLIPLEYFKTAIDWLQAEPNVDPDRLGAEGTSIGGEVVLMVASHYPQIKAVVAAVPSSVVWPGISHSSSNPPSTFTLGGKPLPDLPYGWNGPSTTIYQLYALGLKALDQHQDAVIPVEQINGPVMLICGEEDGLWPSCPMVDQVSVRLKTKNFRHAVTVLKYSDAGHASFGVPAPSGSKVPAKWTELGGSAQGNQAAHIDDWPKSLTFMDKALRP